MGSEWLHVDPCEAAVDEPLLYEGWGKNQTFIFSFTFDDVQDVTAKYTTDFEGMERRRRAEGVTQQDIDSALILTRETLRNFTVAAPPVVI